MRILPALVLSVLSVGCAHPSSEPASAPPDADAPAVLHQAKPDVARYQQIVAAPDRTAADRALDAGRKPVPFLTFLDVQPGQRVEELMAGGGYTSELLARAVAPNGVVYVQNPPFVIEHFAAKPLAARMARPVMKDAIRVDRPMEDPFPAEAKGRLDLVVSNAVYHDTVWLKVDRARMNREVFDALRPGGHYVVCDSSAVKGHGVADAQTLHRIDEKVVRDEVKNAGFSLQATGDFLRNPKDARDWNSSPVAAGARRGTSDRFCLKFVKPGRH